MGRGVDIVVEKLKDEKSIYKNLKAEQKKKMATVMRDLRRDVPAAVANAVSKRYNIKTSEMKPPAVKVNVDKSGNKYKSRKAVDVRVDGEDLDSMAIVYRGRRLTVQRFNMNPKKPVGFTGRPGHRKRAKKDIQATVLRGKRSTVKMDGHRTFVASVRGVNQAVHAKDGDRRIDVVAKTLSVPVMVDNEEVRKDINKGINETVKKSLKRRWRD